MFTGLIEDIGIISEISNLKNGFKISVECNFDTSDVKIGDSIAINGACQTVVEKKGRVLVFEAMRETLEKTNFKFLKKGSFVNLERAMLASSRFDGHMVSGHIDCTSKLFDIKDDGLAKIFKFECNTDLIVEKGSISINGISLTVCSVQNGFFEVSILPHTLENTNLKRLCHGDFVNIEYDMIAKYVKKYTQAKQESKITKEFLIENGF